MSNYKKARDFPALNGTSILSPHLRFGTISCRAAVRAALAVSGEGGDKWLSELIWREFYSMILLRFPEVVEHTFRPEFDDLEYPGTHEYFEAWVEGRTGYPIVDAAMRCFEATGWMHNRLRMVVASFLTKDLLVNYKWGEAYFARKLLDFELASNNGSWQWAASVGADPQPYFRIFNPILQSKKFDSEGKFIRKWCPELTGFSNERIHFPAEATEMEQKLAGCLIGKDYPKPIVDHSEQRQKAISLLEGALERSKYGTQALAIQSNV
jgi:deoxyribodipyrimidine photo-lyase